jgi:hypothetical protein
MRRSASARSCSASNPSAGKIAAPTLIESGSSPGSSLPASVAIPENPHLGVHRLRGITRQHNYEFVATHARDVVVLAGELVNRDGCSLLGLSQGLPLNSLPFGEV